MAASRKKLLNARVILTTLIIAIVLSVVSGFIRSEQASYPCMPPSDGGTELATTYGFPAPYYVQPTFTECHSSTGGKLTYVKPVGFYLAPFLLDSVVYLPMAFVFVLYVRSVDRRRHRTSLQKLSAELLCVYAILVALAGFAWSGRTAEPDCTSRNIRSPYSLEHKYGFPFTFLDRQDFYNVCIWASKKESPKNSYLVDRKALTSDLVLIAAGAGLVALATNRIAKPRN